MPWGNSCDLTCEHVSSKNTASCCAKAGQKKTLVVISAVTNRRQTQEEAPLMKLCTCIYMQLQITAKSKILDYNNVKLLEILIINHILKCIFYHHSSCP